MVVNREKYLFKQKTRIELSILNNLPIGVYRTTPDGRVLMANKALLKILRYPSFKEFANKNIENDEAAFAPTYPRKKFKQFLEKEDEIKLETECIRNDGARIYIRENARAVRGSDDSVLYYEGTIEDITGQKLAAEALKQSEERYRTLVNMAPDVIYSLSNEDGLLTSLNPAFEKLTGWSDKEWLGKKFTSIVHPEDVGTALAMFQKSFKEELIPPFELRIKAKSGEYVVGEFRSAPPSENGRKFEKFGIARDITERKQMEEIIFRMAAIIESSRDCIIGADLNGIITNWNKGAEKIYGYSKDEAIGKSVYILVDTNHVFEMAENLRILKEGGTIETFETIRVKRNGESVHVSVSVFAIKNAKGELIGTGSITRDITEKKALEQQIDFHKNLLEVQSEASIEGILMISDKGKVISYNTRFLEMWNVKKDSPQSILNTVQNLVVNGTQFVNKINKLSKRYNLENTEEISLKSGKTYECYSKSVENISGGLYGRIWFFHDISERIVYERQREALVGVAGHELKTPITSIKAYVQILQKHVQENKDQISVDYLGRMNDQVDKMIRLTRDLLDVIKLRVGKLEFKLDYVEIDNLIKATVDDIQRISRDHNIFIKGRLNKKVLIDEYRISQLLSNLLTNAIKYSPNSKKIIVTLLEVDGYILVSVKDFGIGIDEESQKQIFESFFRVNNKKREIWPGLGLGLYLATEIINYHNGKIWVESKKGLGSTFYFTLPIKIETLDDKINKSVLVNSFQEDISVAAN